MATSMLALLGLAGAAFGQSTPPGWAGPGDRPAKTTWQQFPDSQRGTMPTLPSAAYSPPPKAVPVQPPATPLNTTTQPAIGSRVIVYTKPADDIRAVQATDEKAKPKLPDLKDKEKEQDPDKAKDRAKDKEDEKNLDEETAKNKRLKPEPRPIINPFRLATDRELAVEITDSINVDSEKKAKEQKVKAQKITPDAVLNLTVNATQPKPIQKAGYPSTFATLEPGYVVHRRLFFEDQNSERFGWDFGMAQPFISSAYFYKDVLLWPHHLASNFSTRYDTNAGKCPPGSPVAYYFYPPELTVGGSLVGTTAVLGTIFLLP